MENLPLTLQNLLVNFLTFLPKLAVAIVILVLTLYLAGVAKRLIKRTLSARRANIQATQLLAQLAQWGIWALGIVTALQQVDFDITGLVAGLGIVGFALGFALQDIAANFVSGIILLIQQPFQAGDWIETNGFSGRVKGIDLRTTQILTLDGEDVLIPNGTVLSSSIINYSKSAPKRIKVDVGVAYGSDLDKVRQIALDAVRDAPFFMPEKPSFVRFHTFEGSSINLTVFFWVDASQIHPLDAKDAGVTRLKKAFNQAGIEIPYPTQKVLVSRQEA